VCGNVNTVFVKSLATVQDRMLMLLDMERLIADSIADKQLSGAAA
jgi:chemotaxis signal transduction protein